MARKTADWRGEWAEPKAYYHATKRGFIVRKMVGGTTLAAYCAGPNDTDTRTQAMLRYDQKVKDYKDGIERVKNYTAAEWIESVYLEEHLTELRRAGEISPQTLRSYKDRFQHQIKAHLGRKRLEEITPPDVEKIVRAAVRTGRSASTANSARGMLQSALAYAEYLGLIPTNPVRRAKSAREPPHEMVMLSSGQIEAFFREARTHRYFVAIVLTVATGMRSGEVRGLRWQDVDLDAGVITLREQYQRIDGKDWYRPLKGRRGRTIVIPPTLIPLLRERRAAARAVDGLCFPSRRGLPMHQATLWRYVNAVCTAAGIGKHRVHALRHTCASILAARGVSIYDVAALLGHADPTVTQRIYTHLFPDHESRAAGEMDVFLGKQLGMMRQREGITRHSKKYRR